MHFGLINIHVCDIGVTITCLDVMYIGIVKVFFNVCQQAAPHNRCKSKCYAMDCAMWESMEAKVTSLVTSIT
jgi:hypothetical protein